MNTPAATYNAAEKRAEYARIAGRLYMVHRLLTECESGNIAHGLGLDLPKSGDILIAMATTAKQFRREFP